MAMAVGESDESNGGDVFPANFAEIVASLPRGPPCLVFPSLRQYRGFWLPEGALLILPAVHASFERRGGTDVLLASFPKSGTTWLKALAFAITHRSVHSPLDLDAGGGRHPLLSRNPHDCVKFIESLRYLEEEEEEEKEDDDGGGGGGAPPPPRLLATHLPYTLLPRHATAEESVCRIVYISRDPKDTLVSLWHFKDHVQMGSTAMSFEEAFELYLRGCCGLGPQWEHARGYWEASRRRPSRVLCLRYEEMLQAPAASLRKMAEFMGRPFSAAEEAAGVVDAVLELCSIEKQRGLAVNTTGAYTAKGLVTIENKHFFRKGVAGDWRNHMTSEMAARMDGVVDEALKGSGFAFADTK
ncbi:hypothetical protein ACP4OV_014890 [Aristida adscensionis]